MSYRKSICVGLMVVSLTGAYALPAFAQNRFMDEARDAAARRAENKAVREAEQPAPAKTAAATPAPAPAPAEQAQPAQPAPAQAAAATPAPAHAQ